MIQAKVSEVSLNNFDYLPRKQFPQQSRLCEVSKGISSEVWRMLSRSSQLGLSFGEETLTDLILFWLQDQPIGVSSKKFSRHEESSSGADWEWWFVNPLSNGAFEVLCCRVQAKKMNIQKPNYPQLNYKKGTQLSKLLRAREHGMAPLYLFYNGGEDDKVAIPLQELALAKHLSLDQVGCTLCHAKRIQSLKAAKTVTFADVVRHSFPLSKLVCPDGAQSKTLSQRVHHGLVALCNQGLKRKPTARSSDWVPAPETRSLDEIPGYVLDLLSGLYHRESGAFSSLAHFPECRWRNAEDFEATSVGATVFYEDCSG